MPNGILDKFLNFFVDIELLMNRWMGGDRGVGVGESVTDWFGAWVGLLSSYWATLLPIRGPRSMGEPFPHAVFVFSPLNSHISQLHTSPAPHTHPPKIWPVLPFLCPAHRTPTLPITCLSINFDYHCHDFLFGPSN